MRPHLTIGRILPITVLAILAASVLLTPIASRGVSGEEATFCLGFILIFAFYLAKILRHARLPEISGYIIAGVVCGPYVFNILSPDVVRSLQIFDDVALAIIAFIAGGEMRLSFLRKSKGAIFSVIGGQVGLSFVVAFAVVFLVMRSASFMAGAGIGQIVTVSLVLGIVIAARSPATTIGVITEMRARGAYTSLIVGVTVLLDVVVLVLIAIVVPLGEALTSHGGFALGFARDLLLHVVGSIVAGMLFGTLVGAYIRWVGAFLPLFLAGIGFVGSIACRQFDLEPLLAFMVAGFMIENFTSVGEKFIQGLERSALPVYVVFFAISGASINLEALRAMWLVALVIVVARALAFIGGGLVAARMSNEVKPHARTLWLGLLSQAGVTIGVATIIEREFVWGAELKTIILAVVALNQLIGPVSLRYILERCGEAGAALRHRSGNA